MASLFLRSRGSFSQIDSEDSPPNFYKLALLFYKVPFTSFDGENTGWGTVFSSDFFHAVSDTE